jgi:hypothetical protein
MKHIPLPAFTARDFAKFWSKVSVRGPKDCWCWLEHVDKDGYPPFRLRGHRYKAARVALFLATGADPGELLACHRCNNPRCCNPSHLYAGTCSDNLQQAVREGRAFVGEKNGRARLTVKDARAIRASSLSDVEVANWFGVARRTIEGVRTRRTWRHV